MTHPIARLRFPVLTFAFASAWLAASCGAAVGPQTVALDPTAYARVLHVDQARGSDPDGDGSQAKPWSSVTHALEMAGVASTAKRVAVIIAEGRYNEPTFFLKSHVDLYGGFASADGARDILRHPTILDGGEAHRIAFGANDARVDGVEFAHGRVRGKGAALLCEGTSPVITNCLFVENRTLIPEPWAPVHLHETANDGGAVMITNGAAPRLEHDLFSHNTTECGRGGAVAVDRRSSPRIADSVFVDNHTGLVDPMRSSDGGAIAVFDRSAPDISGNVISANQSLTKNDAGGLWVALWSAPRIAGNVIVGNEGADDSGGLFLGGQEHRYGVPLDPYPPANEYTVVVENNVLVGNVNGSRNSGATRITMESRVRLSGNVIAENAGGLYLQRSEVEATHNTVWQDWKFLEDKPSLGPSHFVGNVLEGPTGAVEARASFEHNLLPSALATGTNRAVTDIFEEDGVRGTVAGVRYDPTTFTTTVSLAAPLPAGTDYTGRPVSVGDSPKGGQWRAIQHAAGREIVLWGELEPTTKPPKRFWILRTFTPRPDAPAGFGARSVAAR